jgi:3,4-dihydroxy-9,10-secoandrosta-1,3,5(10)-triene-9,17-dione 4,5-dioxygenase
MKIKALGYVGIESTDPEQWRNFMTRIVGFSEAPSMAQTAETLYFKMDQYSWRVCVFKSDKDRFSLAGWEVESKADFDEAVAELKKAGVALEVLSTEACKAKNIREAVRFKDPGGNDLEIFYYMKLDYQRVNSPANVKEYVTGYHGDMGLGHFVIPTAKFHECHDFYTKVLGFGQTDYMHFHFNPDPNDPGQGLHFLHVNNPRHHSLALFHDNNPPASNCVHLMFEVPSIDEVGYFTDRCKKNNVKIVSSLGRHTNDLMMSVYVASPGGFAIEFGCDGVQLDWDNYKPTESSVPSLWGHDWQV